MWSQADRSRRATDSSALDLADEAVGGGVPALRRDDRRVYVAPDLLGEGPRRSSNRRPGGPADDMTSTSAGSGPGSPRYLAAQEPKIRARRIPGICARAGPTRTDGPKVFVTSWHRGEGVEPVRACGHGHAVVIGLMRAVAMWIASSNRSSGGARELLRGQPERRPWRRRSSPPIRSGRAFYAASSTRREPRGGPERDSWQELLCGLA